MSKEKDAKPVEFMGKALTTTPGADKEFHQLPRNEFHSVLDSLGVTKEVRETVENAEETIHKEAISVVGQRCVDTGKDQELVLGQGHNSHTIRMKVSAENNNPKTGEKITSYGQTSITVRKTIGKDMDAHIEPFSQALEKKFGKKK
jgi:hypothetical protein